MKNTVEEVKERAQDKEGTIDYYMVVAIFSTVDSLEELRGDHEDVTAKL